MTIAFLFVLALQQPSTQTPTRPPATTQAPAQPGATAPAAPRRAIQPTTATVDIKVVDRSGRPISKARVDLDGPTSRTATTETNGTATFETLTPGNYRVRAEGEGFVSLEKEVTVKAMSARQSVLVSLSAAPAPPAPEPKHEAPLPSPPPAAAAPVGTPGEPRTLSIPDLAEHSLSGKDPLKVFPIGCSGASQSRLVVIRESIPSGANTDADETLYLVAGDATLTLGGKEQAISPGWFAIVPRGTNYAIGRKGKNPVILLSTLAGRACGATSATHQ